MRFERAGLTARTLLPIALIALFPAGAIADDEDEKPDLPLEGKTEPLTFTTDEVSWASIDVLQGGDSIVFDLLGDLYTLPVGGGDATRITAGLGFDSQPVVSPDGEWIAFVSDRNGSDNLWIARIDGSDARKLSDEKQWGLISPAWTPDGRYVIVTRTAQKPELTMYHVDGGSGITLTGETEEDRFFGVGVAVSPDGRYAYFAKDEESAGPVDNFPATQISRYEFATGRIDKLTQAEGGAFRPVLSPDGRSMVYGTRHETQTGLRIRNLSTGADRWLTWRVQRDAQENYRPPSRDVLPGYAFTPDGAALILNADGRIWRVDVATGDRSEIPFSAEVNLDVGPDLTSPYRVPQGDVTATLIHDPRRSPDGERIAASVLTKIYVSGSDGSDPGRLTSADAWEYKPVWSPDGRWIAYVTWSQDGGHIWRARSNGRGSPERLSDVAAFYTDLVYGPDGETLYAMRASEYMRHQTFSEFGGLRVDLELVSVPADGGTPTTIMSADGARYPHFGPEPDRIYLSGEEGLFSVRVDGTDRRDELVINAQRGNRRGEEPPKAESIFISPDGRHALAHVSKQVFATAIARTGGKAPVIDIRKGSLPVARLTHIGADFYGWSPDGESVWWAIGNDFYSRPFTSIEFRKDDEEEDDNGDDEDNFEALDRHEAVSSASIDVVAPRNTPSASVILRGANVITMAGSDNAAMSAVLEDQDILIVRNRIEAIGDRGTLDMPANADEIDVIDVIDVSGKTIVPGFIDTHAHWEFRTGDVLEPHNWTLVANLAYGVTAGLDVQTASHDYLAYRDFVETGQSVGQRAFMTARGIFGDTDFQSYEETLSYLRRYADHYHTKNIKSYVVGNRKQRQWVVLASKELGLLPTTEGAGDQRLNLTHAIDGMHGNEHTLPDAPYFRDVVELYARTRTAYTPTLIVQYNAESMREYFFTRADVHDDPKLRRFTPHNRLDELTQRRPGWQRDAEFDFRRAGEQAAKIQRAGGLVGIGAHGELQGLGYHWEMWAFEMGGMTPVEVLRAATIDGARIIGVDQDLGSIEVGKLADMIILDANPLENIRNTVLIDRVVKDGRIYDGDTADEVWPDDVPLAPFWWWDENDVRHSTAPVTP